MEDNFSFDFPELNNLPSFYAQENFEDENNLNVNKNAAENEVNEKNCNILKIYEYLNNDLEQDEVLIEKLRKFEEKLDKYIKN
ncbi:hypothetical protein AAJ76_2500036886 [Vairimorpha ceranae]|nr:hypothetical protein AAJ76_2500036886 [Vairimorpha ceranae]KKO75305.1 hypothetical protein AAJ76_2500036886 [Vairimorpha ceranae]